MVRLFITLVSRYGVKKAVQMAPKYGITKKHISKATGGLQSRGLLGNQRRRWPNV